MLGTCKKLTISKDDTIMLDGAGEKSAIDERCEMLRDSISETNSEYEKEKLQECQSVAEHEPLHMRVRHPYGDLCSLLSISPMSSLATAGGWLAIPCFCELISLLAGATCQALERGRCSEGWGCYRDGGQREEGPRHRRA